MLKKGKKRALFSALLSILVLIYLILQLSNFLSKNITTEFASAYEFDNKITADGYIIRDEETIASPGSGVIGYCQQSGDKVAAQSVVAEAFSTEEQATAKSRINDIDKILTRMEKLQSSNRQMNAGAEFIDAKIRENIFDMLEITDTGKMRGYSELAEQLLEYIDKKQMASGGSSDLNLSIASLVNERESLLSAVGSAQSITCESAGYFVSSTDGYEGRLKSSDISELTAERLDGELNFEADKNDGIIGKIISGNEWYVAVNMKTEQAKKLQKGQEVNIYLPMVTSEKLLCRVSAINQDYSADRCMVAFMCDRMDIDLTNIRKETVEICVGSYDGLKVSSTAVRVNDGVTGVYVLSGINAAFKPIEILYSDSAYVICKNDVQNSSGLRIYDEVIVKGNDLYDGKTVK